MRLLSYQFPVNIVELEAVVERVAIQARAAHDEEAAAKAAALGLTAPLPAAVAGSQSTAGGATALYAQGSRRSCSGAACGGTNACGAQGTARVIASPCRLGRQRCWQPPGPRGLSLWSCQMKTFGLPRRQGLPLSNPCSLANNW